MTAQEPDYVKELTANTCAHAKVARKLARDTKVQMACGYLCQLVLVVYLVAAYASYVGGAFPTRSDEDKHLTVGEMFQLFFSLPVLTVFLPLVAVILIGIFRERVAEGIIKGSSKLKTKVARTFVFIDMFFPNNSVSNALSKMSSEFRKLS